MHPPSPAAHAGAGDHGIKVGRLAAVPEVTRLVERWDAAGTASHARAWLVPVLAGAAVVAFLVILLHAPARFMGVDDAYYLGIGANIWAGRGPFNAFGSFAASHAPLWPLVIAAPRAWFGADSAAWAHLLAVLSGASIVGLAGWFAWRSVRPAAALAAATMLGFPFVISLATGMGLDLPASALVLAYLAVGITAATRGSLRWAIAAGALFALAFLVKEIALPFAPVPILAGLARRTAPERLLRAGAAMLLTGALGTSWWFALYAGQVGTVYRLGTPAWTLVPLAAGTLALGVAGMTAHRWLPDAVAAAAARGNAMPRLAAAGAVGWSVALAIFFSRASTGLGGDFLTPAVVASNVRTWLPDLGPALAVGLVGTVLAIAWRILGLVRPGARVDARPPGTGVFAAAANRETWLDAPGELSAVDDLLIALVCGIPLVLEVVSVGEGPRHYVSLLAILVALGSAGWLHLASRLARHRTPATIAVAGAAILASVILALPFVATIFSRRLAVRMAILAGVLAVLAIVAWRAGLHRRLALGTKSAAAGAALSAVLAAAALLALMTVPSRTISTDRVRASAIGTVTEWVRANVPRGASVVFGTNLAFETALRLQSDYRTLQVRDVAGVRIDPSSPLGVREGAQPMVDDWVALRASPTDVTTLYGYRATTVLRQFQGLDGAYWILTDVAGSHNPTPIVSALRDATGAKLVGQWTWPYGSGTLQTTIFEVDSSRLAFTGQVSITVDALQRIVAQLERDPIAGRAAAMALARRAVVIPAGADAEALLARLRRIASP